MTESLRDQLLGLGFKAPAPSPKKPAKSGNPRSGNPRSGKHGSGKHGSDTHRTDKPRHGTPPSGKRRDAPRRGAGGRQARGDIDLAKAYAIRAQREKDERIAAEQARQEQARLRREALLRLDALLEGRVLNADDAEIARHFEYGGKIKRVYVTAEQLSALNAGRLGVVQLRGRYVLVDAATLADVEALFQPAVALKVDPDAPGDADPYADPRYQVPDDLTW